MRAEDICDKAASLVNDDRHKLHGDRVKNQKMIAALWSAFLDVEIPPSKVPVMLALVKVARIGTGAHNPDNYVDMIGYAGIAGELSDREHAGDSKS